LHKSSRACAECYQNAFCHHTIEQFSCSHLSTTPFVSSEYFVCIAITLSLLAQSPFIMVFSVHIDVIIVHDFMMLVLSCHAHVPCPCIIRIALPLLLSSVAMFLHLGRFAVATFSVRCNVERVSYLPSGWHQYCCSSGWLSLRSSVIYYCT
jgi:hypothetical protein